VKSCSQLADAEALVLGELDAAAARRFRDHAQSCVACREEIALVTAERALFARRAEVMCAPPALASAVRRQIEVERSPLGRALAPAVGRLLRHGQLSAACAAALFVVAAFSRVGNTAMAGAASIVADDETKASGMLASFRTDEPTACSLGSGPSVSYDDGATTTSSSSLSASRGEALACRESYEGARSSLPCEPFVTCSWLRQ